MEEARYNLNVRIRQLFEHGEPLTATPGVVGGGTPCCVPTWVERAKNNTVLNKSESTFRKFQFLL